MAESLVFKLVLLGDSNTGKTSYVQRLLTGHLEAGYPPRPVQVDRLCFNTNFGIVTFEICDVAGEEKFHNQRRSYYADADCAIIMFDFTSINTYSSLPAWHRDLLHTCSPKHMPTVLVGNKTDVIGRPGSVKANNLRYHLKMDAQYYHMSVKTEYNIEKPFLWLARELVGDQSLEFAPEPATTPPQVSVSETSTIVHLSEVDMASRIAIPE